jgi:hypothetical protein
MQLRFYSVNCEGCEWELAESLLAAGVVGNIDTIQFGTHWFPGVKAINER